MSSLISKPYVVEFRDKKGATHLHNVRAYDAMEAVLIGNMRMVNNGNEADKIIDVRPDEEELARMAAMEKLAASSLISDALRLATRAIGRGQQEEK